MRITKVKWDNHPILRNLALDFVDQQTGTPFETILLAGENGTGKTSILEGISGFLNGGSFQYFEYIEYSTSGRLFRAEPAPGQQKEFYTMVDDAGDRYPMHTNANNLNAQVDNNPFNIRFTGCVFSKARADYKTSSISAVTGKQLDAVKGDMDKEDDFTSLKQLMIDIQSQDNNTYAETNQQLAPASQSWDVFYPTSKIYKFKNAFDNFFIGIKYDKVQDINGEKTIQFNKAGTLIPIDQLSTGEKQIVFRGIYLLRNSGKLGGGTIMVDEPELSMHPKWQQKALIFYKDLFTQAGQQSVQLFFATHSEHILKDALGDKTHNLVYVLTNTNGTIVAHKIDTPGVLPSITSAETNYLAFDIVSNDYHIELYGWLQHRINIRTVKACDNYILAHAQYNAALHHFASVNPNGTTYSTLPTFVRNLIDHPTAGVSFTDEQLRVSTELLIELCR